MTNFPTLTGMQLVKALQKDGFELLRSKGSHHILRHPDGRRTVIPVHRGETIGRGLLASILKECEITRQELTDLLH